MLYGYRPGARSMSCVGLGLILLVMLGLPLTLTGLAGAQTAFTPTVTIRIPGFFQPQATLVAPPILITRTVPAFVVTGVRVSNLETTTLTDTTNETTADIVFEDQFKAALNIQSPSAMRMGESRVITLEVIPELLAQASMVRADLLAIKFESLDDGQPEKTVLLNTPVRWNWNIAPKEVGEQEFFLALSYINSQGSRVHWQNIILQITVSQAVIATNESTVTPTITQADALPSSQTTIADTPASTGTPTPTVTMTESPAITLTSTITFGRRVSEDVAENPATYLGILVTLVLGLLTVYFQHIRKKDK